MKVLITGGAGFIGSAVIRHIIRRSDAAVVNVDKLTYAATPEALEECAHDPRYAFEKADICDADAMRSVFARHQPNAVMHLAAESHVDRSIDGPGAFIQTNIIGTYTLLQAARGHYDALTGSKRDEFRFHHVSTDEVFGSLGPTDPPFCETTAYDPNSPYSASKAASDHLVRAWGETYGLPVVVSNCSNNYGPWQYPEKLIPVLAIRGAQGLPLPIYGAGDNIRDWLHAEDHAAALWTILTRGKISKTYTVGGDAEQRNIDVARAVCAALDRRFPDRPPHATLITYVADRPGHDQRYAVDSGGIARDLGWAPTRAFATGLAETVDWYLDNAPWWRGLTAQRPEIGARLGLTQPSAS